MAQLLTFNLGTTGKASTTGYEFYDASGSSLGARSVTGVTEFGTSGIYFRTQSLPAGAVAVVWNDTDTGKWAADDAIALNDKTGYALTSAYDLAKTAAQAGDAMALTSGERTTLAASIWNALTSGMTTVGSIGKKLADWVVGQLAASQPDYAPAKAGDEMDLVNAPNATAVAAIQDGLATPDDIPTSDITGILADTDELQTDWANGGRLDLLLDAIKAVTDADGGANAIETGISKLQAIRALLAALAGVATGGNSTSIVLKNPAGDTTRVTLTVDADGNRSASVLNV